MAVTWSQFLTQEIDYKCDEIGHSYTPSCLHNTAVVTYYAAADSFKTYLTLYLFSSLLQGKLHDPSKWKKIIQDLLRSTMFLTWNGGGFVTFMCIFRWLFKTFYYPTVGFLPGFGASLTAIFWERKARRQLLTVYMLNTASDIIYRVLRARNLIKPIPHGEVLMFSLTMAGFLYLYKKRENSKDITSRVLGFIIGSDEGGKSPEIKSKSPARSNGESQDNKKERKSITHYVPVLKWVAMWYCSLQRQLHSWKIVLKRGSKCECCPHEGSCIYYCIAGFLRPFLYGYGVQIAINLISSLRRARRQSSGIVKRLFPPGTVRLGLCLGLFCGSYKLINCVLRTCNNQDEAYYGLIGGFVAGWAMLVYPAPALSTYLIWKLVEALYIKGMKMGITPQIPYGIEVLYALLTGYMFHVSMFEPHNLKPSYWKFLLGMTNNKMAEINRYPLRAFGVDGTPFNPVPNKLDPKYTSDAMKRFLETVAGAGS